MTFDPNDLGNLFNDAVSGGMIDSQTAGMLSGHLGAVVVAGAAGKAMEDITATDVTLITVLLDASASIAHSSLEDAVRDGYNLLLDTFLASKEQDSILMALWTFNEQAQVVHSYLPALEATRLDRTNYLAQGGTALYDTWCDALASNIAYAQQLRNTGTPCRSVVVVITDGEDVSSHRSAADCARLSRDLLKTEQFTLAFVGVGNSDFHQVARSMGVPADCIEVQSSATPQTLRHVFRMVSQSAIRASRARVQPGGGGFFAP